MEARVLPVEFEGVAPERSERGFTLIELLVVVAIIAILSAIAISLYHQVRIKAFNASAQNDLKNGITAQEAVLTDGGNYLVCVNAGCEAVLSGLQLSPNVSISFTIPAPGQLLGTASHAAGDVTYEFDSAVGTIVEQ